MSVPPGYEIVDFPYHPAVGISSLKVYLSDKPQERGFDSARLRVPVIGNQEIQELEIMHPWLDLVGSNRFRLAAGRFIVYDHANHTLYGFSLGGQVDVMKQDNLTCCSVSSSAPLLILQDDPEAPDRVLADELEALLARRRAAWGLEEAMFVSRMQAAEPLQLLAASLTAIEARLQRIINADPGSQYQALEQYIHHLRTALQHAGSWPAFVPRIEDLI